MPLEFNDLTDQEQLEYLNRTGLWADKMKDERNDRADTERKATVEAWTRPTRDEVIAIDDAKIAMTLTKEPTPQMIRDATLAAAAAPE